MAREPEAGGFRQVQDVAGLGAGRLRVGLFTNNYFPMLGGVPTAVETIRRDLEALGHEAGGRRAAHGRGGRPAAPASSACRPCRLPRTPTSRSRCRSARRSRRRLRASTSTCSTRTTRSSSAPRPAAWPGRARPALRLHVPHALRPVRALRPAAPAPGRAAAPSAGARGSPTRADLVIAPSDFVARRLRTQGVRRPIEVLPTGVDLDLFRPGDRDAARRALGLAADDRVLLYVGRLDREKNLEFLLRRVGARQGRADSGCSWWGGERRPARCARRRRRWAWATAWISEAASPPDGLPGLLPGGRRVRVRLDQRDAGPGRPRGDGLRAARRGSPRERHRGDRRATASPGSSSPRTPPPSQPRSTRSWPTPHLAAKLATGARDDAAPFGSVALAHAPGRRVPPGQGSRGMELRRDDLARAARDHERSRADRLGGTEREIRQAQAEALGRTGERLQRILDQIAALDLRLDELGRAGQGPCGSGPRRRRDRHPEPPPGRGGARPPSPDHPARGAGARAAHPRGAVLPCARAAAPPGPAGGRGREP